MLKQRIITIAMVLPLFLIGLFLLPNRWWGAIMGAGLVWAGREWATIAGYGAAGRRIFPAALGITAAAVLMVDQAAGEGPAFLHTGSGKFMFALAASFWLAVAPSWLYYRWRTRDPMLLAVVGWIVLVPFWYALTWLQRVPIQLLVALGVIWTADVAAYSAGRAFGRRKLAPEISPGKTWEGVAAALLAVAVYWSVVSGAAPGFQGQYAVGLVWVVLLVVLSVEGDLFESWMKRLAGLKDSGTLLPGHGGLLDRVDALASALPFAALYFAYPLFGPTGR